MALMPVAIVALAAVQSNVHWRPLTPPVPVQSPTKPHPVSTTPVVQGQGTEPRPSNTISISPNEANSPAAPSVASSALSLTCLGAGTASKAAAASVFGGKGGWATILGHRDRGFNDQVDLRLFQGDDRIRLPRTMLPGFHGGADGWFKLKNLIADARSIRGTAAVNFMNNPKVFIDRVTGTISISGKAGDYSGQCQVIDVSAAPKF